jgi:hypothetical protein
MRIMRVSFLADDRSVHKDLRALFSLGTRGCNEILLVAGFTHNLERVPVRPVLAFTAHTCAKGSKGRPQQKECHRNEDEPSDWIFHGAVMCVECEI